MPIERPNTVVGSAPHRARSCAACAARLSSRRAVEPRFDYGRRPHQMHVNGTTAVFEAGQERLVLASVSPLERDGDDVRSRFTVRRAARSTGSCSSRALRARPSRSATARSLELYLDTEAFWRDWLERSTYRGRWREAVERSAITLKLLTYAPSGGIVAAPTAGLPEQVGGARNWDYRYTWVRDGSFSVVALLGLGFTEEAAAFGDWLRRRVEEHAGRRLGSAQDHVPRRRQLRSLRGDARPLRRLHGLASGADRQRRSRPAAARHLRRGHELDPRARQRRARRLGRGRRRLGSHRHA